MLKPGILCKGDGGEVRTTFSATFSLPSPSSDLKVPNIDAAT